MGSVDRRAFLAALAALALAACTDAAGPAAPATTLAANPSSSGSTSAAPSTSAPATTTVGGPARYVGSGPPGSNAVALTFHASGDPDLANRALDLLRDRKVRATVFVVGQWLEANAALATRLVAEGHELGNHTYSHQSMGRLGPNQIAAEIAKAAEVLRVQTGSISRWFRPSAIAVPTPVILAEAGRAGYPTSVGYSVDSLDFQDPGPPAVRRNVAAAATGGAIVSLHFGHQGTIDALPGILDDLGRHGLRPVTVGELLA